jgi:hypothetical protein
MAFVLRCLRDFFFGLRAAFGSCSHPEFQPFTARILGEEAEPIWSKQLTLRSIFRLFAMSCRCLGTQVQVVGWFSRDLKDLCFVQALFRATRIDVCRTGWNPTKRIALPFLAP